MADRLKMVTIEDSVGYVEGVKRFFVSLGIGSYDSLAEWCSRKDHEMARKKVHRERIDIKIKRAQ